MNKYKFFRPKLDLLYYFPLIWIVTGMFWVSKGDKSLVAFVVLSASFSFYQFGFSAVKENFTSNRWLQIILAYVVFASLSYATHGFGSRELRASVVALVYLATLPKSVVNVHVLKVIVFIGVLNCLSISVFFQYINPTDRILWPVNAIPFSNFSALLAILSLMFYFNENESVLKKMLIPAFLFGFLSTILTQSRGVILSLFVVLFFILIFSFIIGRLNKIKIRHAVFGLSITISFLIVSYPSIESRIKQTINEISEIKAGNLDTSIGLRILMYEKAIELSQYKPFLGYGKQLQPYIDQLFEHGEISTSLHKYMSMNFHNGYLEKLVISGIVGLALMFIIIFYPVVYFYHNRDSFWCLFGLVPVSLLYFLSNITDTPFTNGHSFVVYLIFTGLIFFLNELKTEKKA